MLIDWIKDVNASDASTGARALALALLQFMNADGLCWPSQELLADTIKVADRTVRRWMSELEELGLVVREKSRIRAQTGHQCPRTGHTRPVSDTQNRTPVSKNRTPVSALENQEPDTSVQEPDTGVQEPDTSVLKNYPIELSNRTIQSVPCTLGRAPAHEGSLPGSALDSDDRTDEEALYMLAVFHELKKYQVTTEQCVELVKDARSMGATLADLESEIRTCCEKLKRAAAHTLLAIIRENLELQAPARIKTRRHLMTGGPTRAAPRQLLPELSPEEQLKRIPF